MSIILISLSIIACGTKDTDSGTIDTAVGQPSIEDSGIEPQENLSMIGEWEDNYGTSYTITQTDIQDSWGSSFSITEYNNAENWLIAQNGASNPYNPNLWSKFEWFVDTEIYYCQSAYDAPDADTAHAIASDTNDKQTGCNGFPWSILREKISILGNYNDNYETAHQINSFVWTFGSDRFLLSTLNNLDGWVTAKNDSENAYNPDLWSKFEWFQDADTLYYCQSAYNKDSEEIAMSVFAERTDTETGCGGFSWSILTLAE